MINVYMIKKVIPRFQRKQKVPLLSNRYHLILVPLFLASCSGSWSSFISSMIWFTISLSSFLCCLDCFRNSLSYCLARYKRYLIRCFDGYSNVESSLCRFFFMCIWILVCMDSFFSEEPKPRDEKILLKKLASCYSWISCRWNLFLTILIFLAFLLTDVLYRASFSAFLMILLPYFLAISSSIIFLTYSIYLAPFYSEP